MTLLRIENLTKTFAGVPVLQGISWQIEAGRKIGLIGANGSGKSTLLSIMSGVLGADQGIVERARGISLGYLTQEMTIVGERSLFEEVLEAFRPLLDMQAEMALLEQRLTQPDASDADLQRYGIMLEEFTARQGYTMSARVEATLFGLGFGAEALHTPVRHLSGGQKNMAALARVLLQEPDLLLLDEPSNHLDIVATEWLEGVIREYRGSVVVISHDRYFLDRTVTEIVELDHCHLAHYGGNYSAYVAAKATRFEQQQKAYEQQQAEIRRQQEFIRRNIAGQKTRQAQSRQKALERLERVERPDADRRRMHLHFVANQRENHEVVVGRKVWKSFGERAVLRGLSCTVYRGDKVGLMGPNGAGKSTLVRLLMGQETPESGTLRLGQNVVVAYYDQEMHGLDPQCTVLDEVWQMEPLWTMEAIRGYLGRFLFTNDEVLQHVGQLSGGEKSRVALAKLMLSKANFLILDEPTNHLDIPGREALETALADYPGTLLLVSHDRYFLDRVVTRLLYLRDGVCDEYPGNYSAYQTHLATRQQPVAVSAVPVVKKPVTTAVPRLRPERLRKVTVIEHEISQVEAALAALQQSIEAVQQDADWQQLVELTTQQGALTVRLDRLMSEWEDSMQGGGSR